MKVLVLAALLLQSAAALAQTYPAKPIKAIVPFAPGGVTDVVARIVFPKAAEFLGQPIIIENHGGAGGTLGTAIGAKAAPDGYTLTIPAASHTTTPSLYSRLPFDPVKDFSGVTELVLVPYMLVVPASIPAKTVKDFIAYVKANPKTVNFGSAGNGSSNHLAGELLRIMSGTQMVHVPYKGSAPALTDLMGGHLTFMFDTINTSLGHIKAGNLRALAIGTLKPSRAAPGVPTVSESGLPGFEANTWIGVLAPSGTPRDVVSKLNGAMVKALALPEIQEKLSGQGAEPVGSSPEEFDAFIKSEIAKWGKVIRDAGVPRAD
jgi:tripartite-type tricarboxylate transporter receptor subunit TctC